MIGITPPWYRDPVEHTAFNAYAYSQQRIENFINALAAADDPNDITLPGYPVLIFPANRAKVALELPNPEGNPCYFRYTLTIVETEEEIYQSALLEPGKALETITLNRALSAGTYTLRIEIETFSLADGTTPMNGGVQEVKLIVK